jgi:uncharacterized membrane protein (GlpM family)
MIYTIVKFIITSLFIVTIAELAKRNPWFAALIDSLPLISILAMFWIYIDTKDVGKIAEFATGVFWLVIPSLVFFISLPILLKKGLNFYLSMGLSISVTAGCYLLMIAILARFGIKF